MICPIMSDAEKHQACVKENCTWWIEEVITENRENRLIKGCCIRLSSIKEIVTSLINK